MVLGLRTPDLHSTVDATGGQQACRRMWLHAIHYVPICSIHFRNEICGPFPNEEVPVIGACYDVVRVIPEEVGLLDVSRCVAMANEAILVIPRCHAPVLEERTWTRIY